MRARATVISLAFLWFIALPTHAQTTLRWKLQTGQKLAVVVTQTTKSEVVYSGKKTATQIDLAMDLSWRVSGVENGQFRLEQSLDRLSILLDSPSAGRVQYDTAQQTKPTGSAKDIAAALEPLLGARLEITMNDRGEILAAKPVKAADAAAPDAAATTLVSNDSIQQLLRQPLAVLPEQPLNKGDSWSTTSQLTTSLGPATQTTTYRYAGPTDVEGTKLEQITVTAALKVTPSPAAKITVKEHQQSGAVLFDAAAGRVVSAEQKQKLVTERPYRETTIVVTLDSTQETKVAPAKESPAAPQP